MINEQLKRMPLIQTKVKKIKGTNLVLHQTIINDIRPIEYYKALVEDSPAFEVEDD